jgi:hypothetical protein
VAVEVAHLERAVPVGRPQLGLLDAVDVEVLAQRGRQRLDALGVARQAAHEPVGREDGEARVLQCDQAHEDVAMVALAADLVGVHAGRLVAVVAVGDEQLGVGQRALDRLDRGRVCQPPQPGGRPLVVRDLAEGLALGRGLERRPGDALGVGVQREDR